ncbi:uncharacterized protein N7511_000309 [Penicillium nucicola]|uniref:uncharacterized protein n=1 Tax=Penicillium nucicola TaxID=1850975 RepID=UPI0025456349|nr:uncharacterized protein N7511_000309 [Penicillium nucicola]KAJ5775298.1 hypothetical protein N7511_000309 [Penicillium nucicola]
MVLRKLTTLFLLAIHASAASAAAIPISPSVAPDIQQEISIPSIKASPTNQAALWDSSVRDPPIDKRSPYYFPETVQDDQDLENEIALRETAMREAGFVLSSSRLLPEVQKSSRRPVSGLNAGIDAASGDRASPASYRFKDSDSKLAAQGGLIEELTKAAYEASEDERVLFPPFGFLVIAAAVVCLITILRGTRSKK